MGSLNGEDCVRSEDYVGHYGLLSSPSEKSRGWISFILMLLFPGNLQVCGHNEQNGQNV